MAFADTMRRFGIEPEVKAERYHCSSKFGFDPATLPPDEKARFFEIFDKHGWNDMPSIPGAAPALRALVAAGHEIRDLTSMPPNKLDDRSINLRARGFPDGILVATGHRKAVDDCPKAPYLNAWKAHWFVDDWAHNFKGVDARLQTRFALILDGTPDHPNLNEDARDRERAHAEFSSVGQFAEMLLASRR